MVVIVVQVIAVILIRDCCRYRCRSRGVLPAGVDGAAAVVAVSVGCY